jgi:DNA repair photolyase
LNYKVLDPAGLEHRNAVIRIENPMEILRGQLIDPKTQEPKYKITDDTRVIYSSTLVDIAANMDLVRETAEVCTFILDNTFWQIRLLTKSNLLPKLVDLIPEKYHQRLILGVSTGTLDDKLASAFEQGCPPPSKRLKSLHWLQDNGFRTYGMLCPSLPQSDYPAFAREMLDAIRVDKCEHVWAEVINVRGESLKLTVACLRADGFDEEASHLEVVSGDRKAWEKYSLDTFRAYADIMPEGKLRYLQY